SDVGSNWLPQAMKSSLQQKSSRRRNPADLHPQSQDIGPDDLIPAANQARAEQGPTQPPRVAVIIPLHRDTPGFRDCLRGCLALEYPSFEVIVVSDVAVVLPSGAKLVLSKAERDTGPG